MLARLGRSHFALICASRRPTRCPANRRRPDRDPHRSDASVVVTRVDLTGRAGRPCRRRTVVTASTGTRVEGVVGRRRSRRARATLDGRVATRLAALHGAPAVVASLPCCATAGRGRDASRGRAPVEAGRHRHARQPAADARARRERVRRQTPGGRRVGVIAVQRLDGRDQRADRAGASIASAPPTGSSSICAAIRAGWRT